MKSAHKIFRISLLISTILIISACGGGDGGGGTSNGSSSNPPKGEENGGGSNDSNSPGENNQGGSTGNTGDKNNSQPVATFTPIQSVSQGQEIRKIRSLDDGFGLAGYNILGVSSDGKSWALQSTNGENFYDINGENGKYSAVGHSICSDEPGAFTEDFGKIWSLPSRQKGCGIESWPDGSLQYSNETWVRANRLTSSRSDNGRKYNQLLISDSEYLPPFWSSVKASGRIAGKIYAFNYDRFSSEKCPVWEGRIPFNFANWKVVGSYQIVDPSGKNIPCYAHALMHDVEWSPGKPYIQFGDVDIPSDYYYTAPADSKPENWVWTRHEFPRPADYSGKPYISSMFWVGDALITINNAGIYISKDNGETWSASYIFDWRKSDFRVSLGAYNCKTGIIAASDGVSIGELKIPELTPQLLNNNCTGNGSNSTEPPSTGEPEISTPTEAISGTQRVHPTLRNDLNLDSSTLWVDYKIPEAMSAMPESMRSMITNCMAVYAGTLQMPPQFNPASLGPESFPFFGLPGQYCQRREETWSKYFSNIDSLASQCGSTFISNVELNLTNPANNTKITTMLSEPPNWAMIKGLAKVNYQADMQRENCSSTSP